jgi:hypothetical protein
MTPTTLADVHGPEDEAFACDLQLFEPTPEEGDDWWLDLGRVEFPGLPAV